MAEEPTMPEDLRGMEKFFTKLASGIGSPIRGLYNVIGNSTVTGATVIGLFIMLSVFAAVWAYAPAENLMKESYARRYNADAERLELANANTTDTVKTVGQFGFISVEYVDSTHASGEGVLMKFSPVRNAVRYEAQCYAKPDTRMLFHIDDPTPNATTGFIEWHISALEFGADWEPGRAVHVSLSAVSESGHFALDRNGFYARIPQQ